LLPPAPTPADGGGIPPSPSLTCTSP
jgi:hypothetical protein